MEPSDDREQTGNYAAAGAYSLVGIYILGLIPIRRSNYNSICTLLHKGSPGNRAVFVYADLS